MDQVSAEAAEALSGEEAFILQLRPPAPPGADEAALADRIDQFTRLYLTGAEPYHARFAHLAPLTWAIAAPRREAALVEQLRVDLCDTLFGSTDTRRIELARQPGADEGCFDHPSAASRAAFDDASEVFDLDSVALNLDDTDVIDVDAWRPANAAPASEETGPETPGRSRAATKATGRWTVAARPRPGKRTTPKPTCATRWPNWSVRSPTTNPSPRMHPSPRTGRPAPK